jgi:signal transduction histidine kinase/ActR/RegA family two-component response regulator
MGMQLDDDGRIWLSTRRGLWRVEVANEHVRVSNYGLRDGFTSQEFIDGCLFMAQDGVLVGGTTDGYVALVDTRMSDVASFLPQLVIEMVSVLRDGARIELPVSGSFRLQAADRQLQVNMSLLSFGDSFSKRYRSRLHGFDADWIEHGAISMREFSTLQAGNFVLEMQALDPAGNASGIAQLHFSVAPAWWRSAWGLAGLTLLMLVVVAMVAVLYQRRLRRRAALQLARHKHELAEQASQAKTQFLATLGHEVRTPMTGVLGMTELLLQTPLDQRQHGYASSIQGAGKHLLRLVNDALDLARIEAGKLPLDERDFDLAQALQQVAALVRPMAVRKGLLFECHSDAGLPSGLRGDVNRVQQILLNLLANAFKFTEHGSVTLLTRLPADHPPGSGICFQVSDTGPGIAEEQCERLFQRFEQAEGARTAARYGGSGLGLAICRELALAMGGRIEVNSQLGRGTDFLVELPLPWSSLPLPVAALSAKRRRALRLLLVEDDPTVAEVVLGLLGMRGHQVTHAAHGLAALAEVSSARFDAVLCDLDLPGLDGLQLIQQLRALSYQYPFIAVTARSDAEAEPQALAAGFDAFLRKPLTGDMLEQAIFMVLEDQPESVTWG